jgi:competence protein ComEC
MPTLLLAQWSMSWVMLPLGITWFGLVAPLGMVANLMAIPWVSLFTLPLTLAGLALSWSWPAPAEILLDMAARSATWLLQLLAFLPGLAGSPRPGPAPGTVAVLLALIGALILTLPIRWAKRWLGLGLVLPLLLRQAPLPETDELRLELLDVGQGLAIILQARDHAMLYDTGPGMPGQWSRVDEVLVPAMGALGIEAPERILVSHADLDHAGGLADLRGRFPAARVHAGFGRYRAMSEPCDEQLGWTWGEIDFQVLHPSPWLPYRGNDSSCVLAVSTPTASLLLPGDVGRLVERRLAGLTTRGHVVLVAPHHGSRSSSSAALLDWSKPGLALVSTAWGT